MSRGSKNSKLRRAAAVAAVPVAGAAVPALLQAMPAGASPIPVVGSGPQNWTVPDGSCDVSAIGFGFSDHAAVDFTYVSPAFNPIVVFAGVSGGSGACADKSKVRMDAGVICKDSLGNVGLSTNDGFRWGAFPDPGNGLTWSPPPPDGDQTTPGGSYAMLGGAAYGNLGLSQPGYALNGANCGDPTVPGTVYVGAYAGATNCTFSPGQNGGKGSHIGQFTCTDVLAPTAFTISAP
jgi:hypothetical protein